MQVAGDDGGIETAFLFIPDDGSPHVPIVVKGEGISELGELARGIINESRDYVTIKASPPAIEEAEKMFDDINAMEAGKRALFYLQIRDGHLVEDCGWAWTSNYKVARAAPGVISYLPLKKSTL